MNLEPQTQDGLEPIAIIELGALAAAGSARLARDLLDLVETAFGAADRRRPPISEPLNGPSALLRAEVEIRVSRLHSLSIEAGRVSAGLNGALAEVRTLRMQVGADATRALLSSRIIHLEACRQSVAVARGLLTELVSAERTASEQLVTGDVADALALRHARMQMLAERARRSAAAAEEMNAAAGVLETCRRAAPVAVVAAVDRPRRRSAAARAAG